MKILDIGSKDEIPSFASRVNPHAPKLKILLDYVLIMYLEGENAIRINPQALFDFEGLCQIQAKYSVSPCLGQYHILVVKLSSKLGRGIKGVVKWDFLSK